jgi:hypothetical protein
MESADGVGGFVFGVKSNGYGRLVAGLVMAFTGDAFVALAVAHDRTQGFGDGVPDPLA